jgi:hypothetical protein
MSESNVLKEALTSRVVSFAAYGRSVIETIVDTTVDKFQHIQAKTGNHIN